MVSIPMEATCSDGTTLQYTSNVQLSSVIQDCDSLKKQSFSGDYITILGSELSFNPLGEAVNVRSDKACEGTHLKNGSIAVLVDGACQILPINDLRK